MVLPLFIHSTNIWSVPTLYVAHLKNCGKYKFLPWVYPQKKKEKKLKIKNEREKGEEAKHLRETDNTNLTGHEKWSFGSLFYLKTKKLLMTVPTFSLPKCQSKLLICKGQAIPYLQSFHRAYAKSAWGRPRTAWSGSWHSGGRPLCWKPVSESALPHPPTGRNKAQVYKSLYSR